MDTHARYYSPKEGFAELADTYDARLTRNPVLSLEEPQVLALLPTLEGKTAADIGCGTGRYALQLPRLGATQVVGLDLSPELLAVAQRKSQRAGLSLEWGRGDLTQRLPLPEAVLDVSVCALTLSFVAPLPAAFGELARVLKPGGILVVSELHPQGLLQERAASLQAFRHDSAPYLRFTNLAGEECRIPRIAHTFSDYVSAAHAAGLTLTAAAEPLVESSLATTFGTLKEKIGLPLALILRFEKR